MLQERGENTLSIRELIETLGKTDETLEQFYKKMTLFLIMV